MSFEGKIGDGEKEPLYVYLMSRMHGITHLDFILAYGFPEDSPDNVVWRQNLIGDIAQYVSTVSVLSRAADGLSAAS